MGLGNLLKACYVAGDMAGSQPIRGLREEDDVVKCLSVKITIGRNNNNNKDDDARKSCLPGNHFGPWTSLGRYT